MVLSEGLLGCNDDNGEGEGDEVGLNLAQRLAENRQLITEMRKLCSVRFMIVNLSCVAICTASVGTLGYLHMKKFIL